MVAICVLQSCSPRTHDKAEIEAAMREYDRLLMKMDADSIALLYDIDGDLGTAAHGRDSIRKFLHSFKNIQMLSQASTSDVVEMASDSATQKGSYSQVDVIGGDTISLRGTYVARWKWNDKEGWRIKRMETTPQK